MAKGRWVCMHLAHVTASHRGRAAQQLLSLQQAGARAAPEHATPASHHLPPRTCLLPLVLSLEAMRAHLLGPCSSTRLRSASSSCTPRHRQHKWPAKGPGVRRLARPHLAPDPVGGLGITTTGSVPRRPPHLVSPGSRDGRHRDDVGRADWWCCREERGTRELPGGERRGYGEGLVFNKRCHRPQARL